MYLSNLAYFTAILAIMNPIASIDAAIKMSYLNNNKTIETQIIIASVLAATILNILSFCEMSINLDLLQTTTAILLLLKAIMMLKITPKDNEIDFTPLNNKSSIVTPLLSPLIIGPELLLVIIFMSTAATSINQKINLIFLNTSAIFMVSIIFLSAVRFNIKINKIVTCILTRFLGIIIMFLAVYLLSGGIKGLYNFTNIM
ncbi:MAG: hypothetical protein HON55_04225 [Legionellales bacterium]|jgi:small neutral amino acid transporter SnatA (MarC family)|nr:hypothetical protein [Legionellales bacterium]